MSSPNAAMVLFVVLPVLPADLLRLLNIVVDVALGVVQLPGDLRHGQSVVLLQHDRLGEFRILLRDHFNDVRNDGS